MKVWIVGAGPGDPELITLKGRRLIQAADMVIHAGSLVNPELLSWARTDALVHDSSVMTLEEVRALYLREKGREGNIVRLHTGDPSVYGAIQEQIDFCAAQGIPVEVIPGVSSAFAAAAALKRELTVPGVCQSVIFTRAPGRTPVPPGQGPGLLASHGATMVFFLSIGMVERLVAELAPHCPPDTPVRVVHRASWPDERIVSGTLADIATAVRAARMDGQALILVGRALAPSPEEERSRLYDPSFSHGRRRAVE